MCASTQVVYVMLFEFTVLFTDLISCIAARNYSRPRNPRRLSFRCQCCPSGVSAVCALLFLSLFFFLFDSFAMLISDAILSPLLSSLPLALWVVLCGWLPGFYFCPIQNATSCRISDIIYLKDLTISLINLLQYHLTVYLQSTVTMAAPDPNRKKEDNFFGKLSGLLDAGPEPSILPERKKRRVEDIVGEVCSEQGIMCSCAAFCLV